jgi:hypothetical protein
MLSVKLKLSKRIENRIENSDLAFTLVPETFADARRANRPVEPLGYCGFPRERLTNPQ